MAKCLTYLGRIHWRGDQRPFGIHDFDRLAHGYVIGKTGTGKSSLLEILARRRQFRLVTGSARTRRRQSRSMASARAILGRARVHKPTTRTGSFFQDLIGTEPTLEDAQYVLAAVMDSWNRIGATHRAGQVTLSPVLMSETPSRQELMEVANHRLEEITWFLRGIDAGGDDPSDFGPEGADLFQKLAEGSAFLEEYREMFQRAQDSELTTGRQALEELSNTIGTIIQDLLTVSDRIRRQAILKEQGRSQRRCHD